MKDITMVAEPLTVGIDLGDRWSEYCVINAAGKVVDRDRVMTCRVDFEAWFAGRPTMRTVMEVGTHSPWASRCVTALGHEVLVANPRRLRMIYQSDRKNDKTDAEMLARVGRMDPELLAPIQHRGEAAQVALAVVRARDALVRSRTQLINHVRGAVKSFGGRLPKSSSEAFTRQAKYVPKELFSAMSPVIDLIGELTRTIRKQDRELARIAREQYPETERVGQPRGVGPLTALTYVLTLEDPSRFKQSRQVGAYLGLRPRQSDSGESKPQLGISKAGNEHLRRLLVSCAQYTLGPFGEDSDLKRWGLELAERGGKNAKRRAVVAVARKLAVLLHKLWVSGADYEPLRKDKQQVTLATAHG